MEIFETECALPDMNVARKSSGSQRYILTQTWLQIRGRNLACSCLEACVRPKLVKPIAKAWIGMSARRYS